MFLSRKKKNIDLMNTVLIVLHQLFELEDIEQNINDCMKAIAVIKDQLVNEVGMLPRTMLQITKVTKIFDDIVKEKLYVNEQTINNVIEHIELLKDNFQDEIATQINILFLPYKASMWDSLSSLYEVAKRDKECVVKVVSIPYYYIDDSDKMNPVYEGNLFPCEVPITHYTDYIFEQEQPDIIFVHNIYDQYNKITRVNEFFFTENLKKYTDMLVYVPYHISEPYKLNKVEIRASYYLPGIKNVDKVILPGKFVEEEALNDGIPSNKILTLGSPKFDSMLKSLSNELIYPEEWKQVIKGKKVILLTTGCTFFCNGKFSNMDVFNQILDIPRFLDEYVLLWRPHPLTIQTTRKFKPEIVENIVTIYERFRNGKETYVSWENVLIDESPDYFPALKIADILITDGGSLMQTYLLTNKCIILIKDKVGVSETFLLPPDAFYYYFDANQPWYKILKNYLAGVDPLRDKRKDLASTIYENTDGTCGQKIFHEVKKCLLNEVYK